VYENSNFLKVQANMDIAIMQFIKNDASFILDFVQVGGIGA
jgi:hypothetical protein